MRRLFALLLVGWFPPESFDIMAAYLTCTAGLILRLRFYEEQKPRESNVLLFSTYYSESNTDVSYNNLSTLLNVQMSKDLDWLNLFSRGRNSLFRRDSLNSPANYIDSETESSPIR